MMIRKMVLIGIFFLISINACMALDIATLDPRGLGPIVPSDAYTGDRNTIFYVAMGQEIQCKDIIGNEESTGNVYGFPANVLDVYGKEDYVYVLLVDYKVYKIKTSIGSRNFATLSSVGLEQGGDYDYMGDISTSTSELGKIVVDANDNVYVNVGSIIYRINSINYLSVSYCTLPAGVQSMGIYSDGLYCAASTSTVYKVTGQNTYSTITISNPTTNYLQYGIDILDNNNFVTLRVYTSTSTAKIYEYNPNGTVYSTAIYDAALGSTTTSTQSDILALPNGAVVIAKYQDDKLYTFGTKSGAGGFSFNTDGNTNSAWDYAKRSSISKYPTYFNNSAFQIQTDIITSIMDADILGYGSDDEAIETFKETTAYQIDILNPDNAPIYTYYYDGNDLTRGKVSIPINSMFPMLTVNEYYMYISDTRKVSSNDNWKTGTYKIVLYEINKISGASTILSTETFIVLNESYNGNIIDEPDPNNPSNTNNPISWITSKYFMGLIAFVCIVKAVGTDRLGRINGNMAIMGVVVACIVLVLTGIFPIWTIFVLVLYGLLLIAKQQTRE